MSTTQHPGRNYHTIGEVLNVLKDDFPDISISKIRFLETQGLLDPERTPSGYRKFGQRDIDRLRFILREQRDRFLPLKVIKTRLEAWERGDLAAEVDAADGSGLTGLDADQAALGVDASADMDLAPSGIALDRRELAAASGLPESSIAQLEAFGVIHPAPGSGSGSAHDDDVYDECALVIAKIARSFIKYGVEARHLRMFNQGVERETALFDQILAPLHAQRSPEARRRELATLAELTVLTRKLHQALLAQSLRARENS
ncbi:MAG: MerR family transcriptional regulator [Acidimicrobiia bacterium]|nr:MerR family transcriptional regulator [Acidimicrobiia bacterium]